MVALHPYFCLTAGRRRACQQWEMNACLSVYLYIRACVRIAHIKRELCVEKVCPCSRALPAYGPAAGDSLSLWGQPNLLRWDKGGHHGALLSSLVQQ